MIIVDVETTGPNPQKHSIISIGAVDFLNPENQFYQECRIWDGAEILKEALQLAGFSKEQVKSKNKKPLKETVKDFLLWTKNSKSKLLAGQNTSFDRDFIKTSAKRYEIKEGFGYRTIDLHSICHAHYLKREITPPCKNKKSDLNLDKILNYVGLPEEPKPHNALTGAKMEAETLSRLIYKKSLLKEFKRFSIPNYL